MDCQVSPWGPWTDCDAECGAGTMSRTRTVEIQPENGGRHCPSLQQRRGCQVSNCHHQDHAIKGLLQFNRIYSRALRNKLVFKSFCASYYMEY